jgi:hypothetical protein
VLIVQSVTMRCSLEQSRAVGAMGVDVLASLGMPCHGLEALRVRRRILFWYEHVAVPKQYNGMFRLRQIRLRVMPLSQPHSLSI